MVTSCQSVISNKTCEVQKLPIFLYVYCHSHHDQCWYFKKFVVTNCKERPGSIVNETLENGILMLRDTLKELDFYADFKYISFVKFSLTHQKLRA